MEKLGKSPKKLQLKIRRPQGLASSILAPGTRKIPTSSEKVRKAKANADFLPLDFRQISDFSVDFRTLLGQQ